LGNIDTFAIIVAVTVIIVLYFFVSIYIRRLPKDLLIFDNGRFSCINPPMFHGAFVQDLDPIEADVMAIVQNTVS
jgi:hypothetical protein